MQARGAGEIVLNCMNQDGVRQGYDIAQLPRVRAVCQVPLDRLGRRRQHGTLRRRIREARVDGALAASVFHSAQIHIGELKQFLRDRAVEVRT